ncbi:MULTISPECIES: hypothetical protein [Trichocoleus]|uniref:Uncharacterized protein n=1 Tax=Trichocoleus desertorum GB2-A4 TaxID=2933944 RepID=A0ABV0J9I3_9CYAN|nr:hypothetical protein [Trichocoleus sp. FACHB-46]MBD1862786.1 hypothetical protein [Trichocoleus sp. FACHB-46]
MLRLKNLVVFTAIAVALAACGPSTDTTTTSDTTTTTAPTTTAPAAGQASPATATSTISVTDLGVQNISEVKFYSLPAGTESTNGYFDAVNNKVTPEHTLPKTDILTLNGWAILPTTGKSANQVIVTQGDQNAVIAIAPVSVERTDVAKVTNNPNYTNSGWTVTLDPATLPADRAVLTAWAYNSDTKEAFQLSRVHTVTFNQ